jgi:integrase
VQLYSKYTDNQRFYIIIIFFIFLCILLKVCVYLCVLKFNDMKYTLNFLIEARKEKKPFAPINIDINYSGERLRYFTGFRLSTEHWFKNPVYNPTSREKEKQRFWITNNWDTDGQRVVSGCKAFEGKNQVSAIQVNRLLNKVDGNIKDQLFDLFDSKIPPTKADITIFLDGVFKKAQRFRVEHSTEVEERVFKKDISFWNMYDRYVKEARVSPARRKQLKVTMNHVKKFDPKLTFEAVTSDKLSKFEKYLLTNKEKPKSKNTVSGQIKKFRAFWNWSKKEITNLHYPFEGFSIDAELYGDPIFLTKAEIDILYKAELSDEKLKRIRDIFLLQCFLGARVGDLIELKTDNLVNGSIQFVPRKTKDNKEVSVSIPLTARAKEIIERYSLPDGRLLPFITQQRYNDYLKELFKDEKVNLNRIVIRLNPLTRDEEAVKICDIASSHLARRTFVGNLFGKVDNSIITSMTGHVQGSKAFARYYSVNDELKKSALLNLE